MVTGEVKRKLDDGRDEWSVPVRGANDSPERLLVVAGPEGESGLIHIENYGMTSPGERAERVVDLCYGALMIDAEAARWLLARLPEVIAVAESLKEPEEP